MRKKVTTCMPPPWPYSKAHLSEEAGTALLIELASHRVCVVGAGPVPVSLIEVTCCRQ